MDSDRDSVARTRETDGCYSDRLWMDTQDGHRYEMIGIFVAVWKVWMDEKRSSKELGRVSCLCVCTLLCSE